MPEYGNTREIGFMCLLRLCLAVAIRQAKSLEANQLDDGIVDT